MDAAVVAVGRMRNVESGMRNVVLAIVNLANVILVGVGMNVSCEIPKQRDNHNLDDFKIKIIAKLG